MRFDVTLCVPGGPVATLQDRLRRSERGAELAAMCEARSARPVPDRDWWDWGVTDFGCGSIGERFFRARFLATRRLS
jgi:hypothetical protein